MSRKAKAFSTNVSSRQTDDPKTRVSESIKLVERRLRSSPAETAASTPETCSSSAGKYAAKGASKKTTLAIIESP